MKRIYWILTSISLYSLLSCSNGAKDTREYQTVKTDTVVSAGGQTSLQYPGKVKAAQDISLAFRVSGTIQKIYVKDGARVQAGQLLAELDPTDYQVQLDATEAEYKQIKAEAERVMALYKDNGTTPNANDKAVYGLKQITAKYRHHKDQLGYTRLYAPFSGYIQKRLFEAHEDDDVVEYVERHLLRAEAERGRLLNRLRMSAAVEDTDHFVGFERRARLNVELRVIAAQRRDLGLRQLHEVRGSLTCARCLF